MKKQAQATISKEPRVRILGSHVHLVPVNRTVDYIERWIEERTNACHRIIVSGFHGLWEAYKNPALYAIFKSADLWVPDGIAPVWIARIRGHRKVERSPGADIMRSFFRLAEKKGYRSYFYGDTTATLTTLETALSVMYPGHAIAGAFSPPFRPLTPDEDKEIVERINAARPDVLWVGLGLPKQENWIYERRDLLKVPVVIGVGAAFGFVAGTVRRSPGWLGALGFEWVYRFFHEPMKLWRRDLLDGPSFVFHVAMELLRGESISARAGSEEA